MTQQSALSREKKAAHSGLWRPPCVVPSVLLMWLVFSSLLPPPPRPGHMVSRGEPAHQSNAGRRSPKANFEVPKVRALAAARRPEPRKVKIHVAATFGVNASGALPVLILPMSRRKYNLLEKFNQTRSKSSFIELHWSKLKFFE